MSLKNEFVRGMMEGFFRTMAGGTMLLIGSAFLDLNASQIFGSMCFLIAISCVVDRS